MSEIEDAERFLRLAKMAGAEPEPLWNAQELADVWLHQLRAPLVACVHELSPVHAVRCEELADASTPPIVSIEDLLHHPTPSVELFTHVARWIEHSLSTGKELLPRDMSEALLSAVLVLARLRCHTALIVATNGELADRANAVMQEKWIDPRSRQLLSDAAAELSK